MRRMGDHAVVLGSGAQVIGEFFPGLLDDLEAGGTPVVRDFTELRFSPAGHLLCLKGRLAERPIYQASRTHLEDHLRLRVRALPTVEIVDRREAIGLVATANRDRVTGVRILRRTATALRVLLGGLRRSRVTTVHAATGDIQ